MIELEFTAEDYRLIRFAISPIGEAVKSLRVLSAGRRGGLHGRWLGWLADTGLPRTVDLELLSALVRPQGYLPDFLGPLPSGGSTGIEDGLAEIAATPLDVVRYELDHLARHDVAQQGPGRERREALVLRLADDPEHALRTIVTQLERYWDVAIAPHWPRLNALLQADLAYRLDELASGGVDLLFRSLHPSVAFRGDLLTIVKYFEGRLQLRGRGLLLVPCAFAWPDVLVSTADPMPSLTYPPRGLGTLWESGRTATADAPLAAVVGDARATILALLDLPMSTTQLAAQLGSAPPTVNVHLKALAKAGIVTARRDGRMVLYRRTPLGDQLVAAGVEQS
ncbi:ArsR/SmtB family transcription factor [Kibdelosporangium aridum]|uniref:ArsR/SmtB family transcription factor n=1 Tax=Kibdelosporangium aridum TaxID=2030 RepID=UPI0035EA6EB6